MPDVGERKWVAIEMTRGEMEAEVGDINTGISSIVISIAGLLIGTVYTLVGSILGLIGAAQVARDTFYNKYKNELLQCLNELETADDNAVIRLEQQYKYHVKGGWLPLNEFRLAVEE